jgi:Flp pilus assembly protein TadD
MSPFLDWVFRRNAAALDPRSLEKQLELARSLAREGREHEASRAYSDIRRRHETLEILLEHAALQLELGDHFGAASSATRALEFAPDNTKAQQIREAVLRH